MRRSQRLLWLLSFLLALNASCQRSEPELPGVRLRELRREAEFLASDALRGREVGGQGIARAEEHIARRFAAAGLRPLPGRSGYLQEFRVFRTGFAEDSLELVLRSPGGERAAEPGRDFRPFPFSGSGERSAPLVFAGYGITAPEHGWDDYRGLEVRGSFVLVLRHEPRTPRFAGRAYTSHAWFRTKAENARRRGAAGLLLVDDPLSGGEQEELSLQASWALEPPPAAPPAEGFLAVHVRRELVEGLLASGPGPTVPDLRRLQEAVDAGRPPAGLGPAGWGVRLRVPPPQTREVRARNVVGFLEGRDPRLRDEWLLVGAHHDHIGAGQSSGDAIYNGADDNASGVTGVLALARLFARSGSWLPPSGGSPAGRGAAAAPRRSIVFATFSAEEQGLLGSQALARELSASGAKVVRMLNLDMIGRNPQEPVQILADDPQGLASIVEAAAAGPPALPSPRLAPDRGPLASDHAAFHRLGVPYLFFFTGLHPDYHGVDDEADRLSYPRLAEVVRLAWRLGSLLADAP